MNPQDEQENYWQEGQQQASADYPQETYQPADVVVEESFDAVEDEAPSVEVPDEVPVQWTAREYMTEEKGVGWASSHIRLKPGPALGHLMYNRRNDILAGGTHEIRDLVSTAV